MGNLGSVVTNYALFAGWPGDAGRRPAYVGSNWTMIGILVMSILSSAAMTVLLRVVDGEGKNGKGHGRAAGDVGSDD
jgi:hypothetical protein